LVAEEWPCAAAEVCDEPGSQGEVKDRSPESQDAAKARSGMSFLLSVCHASPSSGQNGRKRRYAWYRPKCRPRLTLKGARQGCSAHLMPVQGTSWRVAVRKVSMSGDRVGVRRGILSNAGTYRNWRWDGTASIHYHQRRIRFTLSPTPPSLSGTVRGA